MPSEQLIAPLIRIFWRIKPIFFEERINFGLNDVLNVTEN
jgi:hypothetical protein